jgi:Tol biopolymer transport system component
MNARPAGATHRVILPLMLIAFAAATLACACGDSGAPSAGSSAAGGSAATGSPTPTATASSYAKAGVIAFVKEKDLYTIASDGTGRRLIADYATCAAWSPDGDRIAYGSPAGLVVARADGSDPRRVVSSADAGAGRGIAWSPDGERIAFINQEGWVDSQLWVVNADGSGLTNLSAVMAPEGGGGYVFAPAWSPQGRILFSTFDDDSGLLRGIASVDPDGSDLEMVTAADDFLPGFTLSPDGRWLLLWDDGSGGCVRMAANGHGVASVVLEESQWRGAEGGSSWSPDGNRIVFAGSRGLYVVRLEGDGPHLRKVPNTEGGSNPAWQPLPLED